MMNTLPDVTVMAFNSQGIQSFLLTKIAPLILCLIGLAVIASSKKGRVSDAMNTTAVVIVGCIIIGGGAALIAFGDDLANMMFGA